MFVVIFTMRRGGNLIGFMFFWVFLYHVSIFLFFYVEAEVLYNRFVTEEKILKVY